MILKVGDPQVKEWSGPPEPGCTRWSITIGRPFMKYLWTADRTGTAILHAIAHEVGHVVRGHRLEQGHGGWADEFEADKFATEVLRSENRFDLTGVEKVLHAGDARAAHSQSHPPASERVRGMRDSLEEDPTSSDLSFLG